uniref:Ig-like domain-containing protein n=1 Tax=Labrus bergylta TaxID=56723 RepID=A0A3Q3DZZ3_9LABR
LKSIHHLTSQLPVSLAGSRVCAEETPPRIVHQPSDVVVKVGNPARLSCGAEGGPSMTIQWLRNGQPVETFNGDRERLPIVLPEGSLFFLSVEKGRRGQSQEGVYTCVASNSAGTAVSRNASLYIASKTFVFLLKCVLPLKTYM